MSQSPLSTAIIGAGITGLSAAKALTAAGHRPTLFDKSRGVGGRLATRRADGGLSFDHGAPYVTASDPGFRDTLSDLVTAGAAGVWGPTGPWRGRKPWHVGHPGMSGLARELASGVDLISEAEIARLERADDLWHLSFTDNRAPVLAERVLLTVPAPQAQRLLGDHPLASRLATVEMAPCLTLMVAFDEQLGLLFDVLKNPGPELAWIIRNASKPGRLKLPEAWVAHASAEWSARHLETDKDGIARAMLALLPGAMEVDLPEPVYLAGHRWRYACTATPLGQASLADPETGLFMGGDWCLGPNAEDGWLSGQALAKAALESL